MKLACSIDEHGSIDDFGTRVKGWHSFGVEFIENLEHNARAIGTHGESSLSDMFTDS